MWPHKKQSRDTRSRDLATKKIKITNLVIQLKIGVFIMWYYLTHNFLLMLYIQKIRLNCFLCFAKLMNMRCTVR